MSYKRGKEDTKMKKKTLLITAAAVIATGLGIYSIAGKKIALPKKKASAK